MEEIDSTLYDACCIEIVWESHLIQGCFDLVEILSFIEIDIYMLYLAFVLQ